MVGVAAALAFGGCTRKVYIPVETVSAVHDTVRLNKFRTDTLILADSIVIERLADGSVSRREVRERRRLTLVRDTVYLSRRDTLRTTERMEVPVSRGPSLKERAGNAAQWLVVGAIIAMVAGVAFRRLVRLK